MSESSSQIRNQLYEFGPFRVDPEKEVLLRSGEPVQLTPKTFQILLVLVRHSQELVTKDDLLKSVWPDTFVEEANLSRNIFMLRKALGESAQDRQYIITVPGRGYRLAETVRILPGQEISLATSSHSKLQIQVQESNPWPWLAALVIAIVGVTATIAFLNRPKPPIIGSKDSVVLGGFVNSTGDQVFDETLRQGMAIQLRQSPYLNLISDDRIQQTLRLMGQADQSRLSPALSREVCQRTGSVALLQGSIAPLGSEYVLGLKAVDCATGEILDEEQGQAKNKEEVLAVLGRMASKFRSRIGESLATIQQHNTPLPEASTGSIDALRAYSLGLKTAFGAEGPGRAIPFLNKAIELDPQFASAYAMLGRFYGDLGETRLAVANLEHAYRLHDRATDRERFFITTSYEMQVTGDLENAEKTAELWAESYPNDASAFSTLSFLYQELGNYDESAKAGETSVRLDQDLVPGYANLGWAYLLSDHIDQAKATIRTAEQRKLEFPDLYLLRFDAAFLANDQAGMKHELELAEGKPGAEHWIAQRRSSVLAYAGHLKEARAETRRAVQLALNAGQKDRAAMYLAGMATREALFGNRAEARNSAVQALTLSRTRDVQYGTALAFAIAGEENRALELSQELQTQFPQDTFVKRIYLPTIGAWMAEQAGTPEAALDHLAQAKQYEFAIQGSWFGFFGTLYPAYVRGEALLKLGRADEAAVEFEKITHHPGLVASDPIGALAHYQLARALSMQRANEKAQSEYSIVLSLWRSADRESPLVREANLSSASER